MRRVALEETLLIHTFVSCIVAVCEGGLILLVHILPSRSGGSTKAHFTQIARDRFGIEFREPLSGGFQLFLVDFTVSSTGECT
jgi:hypothetical protein